jgi:transcriptional regulator
VPTWNYANVHVTGTVCLLERAEAKWEIVQRLSGQYETDTEVAWKADEHRERFWPLLDMIVGFEVVITDIQAKFKLSQNRDFRDQQNVIAKLEKSADSEAQGVANLMRENLAK